METELMKSLQLSDFLRQYHFTTAEWESAALNWNDLVAIAEHHSRRYDQLRQLSSYVSGMLQDLEDVHSVKVRVKDPASLIAKIVRKRLESSDFSCDLSNYVDRITDLIGVRALHLFKDQWKPIHDFVVSNWGLEEEAFAYVREGDAPAIRGGFASAGLGVHDNPSGYRSVHYLLQSSPGKTMQVVELQVRTLFEEAWSEIDHRLRYPRHSNDPVLAQFLAIFNRLSGSADEMGTFIKGLSELLAARRREADEHSRQILAMEGNLKKTIEKLEIRDTEKRKLEQQIKDLSAKNSEQVFENIRSSAVLYATPNSIVDRLSATNFSPLAGGHIFQSLPTICEQCGRTFSTAPGLLNFQNRCPECTTNPTIVLSPKCRKCGMPFKTDRSGLVRVELCPSCSGAG